MEIKTIKTGSTLVSSAVPNRKTRRLPFAYTGLFQRRSSRLCVPVKCFYVNVGSHHILIDAGWSVEVCQNPLWHLGFGLWFASEPVMEAGEAAVNQLKGMELDAILMTHLDCDHASGLKDFSGIPIFTSSEEIEYSQKNKVRYGKLASGYEYKHFAFASSSNAPFGKETDVFSDGSVIAYLTPTHSAGSVIYKICEEENFALILGDNGYTEESWLEGLLPGPLYNAENMRFCLDWIKEQSKKPNCKGIFCAHDPKDRLVAK